MEKKTFANLFLLAFVFLMSAGLSQDKALADSESGLFLNSCNAFESSEDYAKKANLYCLNQQHTRNCLKQARSYFRQCGYEGDFKRISQEVQRKILVTLLFSRTRELNKTL